MQKARGHAQVRAHPGFCGICLRQCHYEFNTVFWTSCIVFCEKPKEKDPIKIISLRQINVSIALKYIINNSVLNRIRAHFLFFIENICNSYRVLLTQWYTNLCHLTEFIPKSVRPWDCLSFALFVRTCSLYVIVCLFFQRTKFFYRIPWQMPL